jgi:hypothetical protein
MGFVNVAVLVALLAADASAPPAKLGDLRNVEPPKPFALSGRGVHYFSAVGSLGARPAGNRLALDDDASRVTIDPERHRITIVNAQAYPSRQVIADLTFLGTAKDDHGTRLPVAVHLKIEKKKAKVSLDLHPHWTTRGHLSEARLDPFDVAVSDGATETVVATSAELLNVATETKISYSLAGELIELKDNLEGRGPSFAAGGALADLSLGIGSKHINKMLIRAELRSLDAGNAALAGQPAAELLKRGAWQLRLTALSSLLSQETLRRDLFMLGIDRIPVVAAGIARGGLQKGETLAFTIRAGKGRVAWGDKEDDLPAPIDVAQAFLRFNFLGAVLARQVELASAAVAAAPPTPQKR